MGVKTAPNPPWSNTSRVIGPPHTSLPSGIQHHRSATGGPRCQNQEGHCHENADQEEQVAND